MATRSGEWDWEKLFGLIPQFLLNKIAVARTYEGIVGTNWGYSNLVWQLIWRCQTPQRVHSFLWLAYRDCLLTNGERAGRGITDDACCNCCVELLEAILHVLHDCVYAKNVWNSLLTTKGAGGAIHMGMSANANWEAPEEGWMKLNTDVAVDRSKWNAVFQAEARGILTASMEPGATPPPRMGEERVKEEALQLIGMFQLLPRLVVFDLDYTLWPFYCQRLSKRETPSLYPHAKGILYALQDKRINLAIASRSPTADTANTFLDKLSIKSMFVTKEIFFSCKNKTDHFRRIQSRTGIPFNSMLFFDDEDSNIEAASKMGVTSIYVDNGVNLRALRRGLTQFTENQNASDKNQRK
ncbi:hypothetical protein GOBAR_DD19205 [Gossypium barbadense]|nr:hypothetical protein GOBAR_DD19205 [Gossypium barbadense]